MKRGHLLFLAFSLAWGSVAPASEDHDSPAAVADSSAAVPFAPAEAISQERVPQFPAAAPIADGSAPVQASVAVPVAYHPPEGSSPQPEASPTPLERDCRRAGLMLSRAYLGQRSTITDSCGHLLVRAVCGAAGAPSSPAGTAVVRPATSESVLAWMAAAASAEQRMSLQEAFTDNLGRCLAEFDRVMPTHLKRGLNLPLSSSEVIGDQPNLPDEFLFYGESLTRAQVEAQAQRALFGSLSPNEYANRLKQWMTDATWPDGKNPLPVERFTAPGPGPAEPGRELAEHLLTLAEDQRSLWIPNPQWPNGAHLSERMSELRAAQPPTPRPEVEYMALDSHGRFDRLWSMPKEERLEMVSRLRDLASEYHGQESNNVLSEAQRMEDSYLPRPLQDVRDKAQREGHLEVLSAIRLLPLDKLNELQAQWHEEDRRRVEQRQTNERALAILASRPETRQQLETYATEEIQRIQRELGLMGPALPDPDQEAARKRFGEYFTKYFDFEREYVVDENGNVGIRIRLRAERELVTLQWEQALAAVVNHDYFNGHSLSGEFNPPRGSLESLAMLAGMSERQAEEARFSQLVSRTGEPQGLQSENELWLTVISGGAGLARTAMTKGAAALIRLMANGARYGVAYNLLSQVAAEQDAHSRGETYEYDLVGQPLMAAATGAVVLPIAQQAPVASTWTFAGLGGMSAINNFRNGNYFSGTLDLVTSFFPLSQFKPRAVNTPEVPAAPQGAEHGPASDPAPSPLRLEHTYVPGPAVDPAILQRRAKPVEYAEGTQYHDNPDAPNVETHPSTLFPGVLENEIPALRDQWLGPDYVQVGDQQVWRSADGQRQFRALPGDVAGGPVGEPGAQQILPHVHLETLLITREGSLKVLTNTHVPILPPAPGVPTVAAAAPPGGTAPDGGGGANDYSWEHFQKDWSTLGIVSGGTFLVGLVAEWMRRRREEQD